MSVENKENLKDSKNSNIQVLNEELNQKKIEKLKAGLFLTFVTAIGLFSGFGFSLSSTKKRETKNLKGDKLRHYYNSHDSGVELARRALARATLYSVGGFSFFCLAVWKLSGANNFDEFRKKIGSILPTLTKPSNQQQGRTEFSGLTDLIQYIIDEDRKKKRD